MNPEYVGSHPAPRSAHPHAGLAVPTTAILGSWLTTTDHKRIGILYGVSAFVFFRIGGVDPRRREFHRDDPERSGARSELHADAALHLDDPGRAIPRPARLSPDHVRAHLPDVRPLLRDALLRRGRGRRPPSVAAPVLDLR